MRCEQQREKETVNGSSVLWAISHSHPMCSIDLRGLAH